MNSITQPFARSRAALFPRGKKPTRRPTPPAEPEPGSAEYEALYREAEDAAGRRTERYTTGAHRYLIMEEEFTLWTAHRRHRNHDAIVREHLADGQPGHNTDHVVFCDGRVVSVVRFRAGGEPEVIVMDDEPKGGVA